MTRQAVSPLELDCSSQSSEALLPAALARVARLEMALAASGGTLHDVNNLLTVLSGNLYLLTESLRHDATMLDRCRTARDTAQRAGALIRELLTAARPADDGSTSICPAALLTRLQPVLQRAIGTEHRLSVQAKSDVWRVAVSAAQLESAVANLVINAGEALDGAGRIDVIVANVPASGSLPDSLPRVDHVRVAVRDNGVGIPAEKLRRVTEPLYTSKPAGLGSGMGLTMATGFAEAAGGRLTIESAVGVGTRVSIWLPRASASAVTASLTMPLSTLPSGDETILVVEDDEDTQGTLQQLLEALGYRVHTARDRSAAATLLRQEPDIALIVAAEAMQDEAWRRVPGNSGKRLLSLTDPNREAGGTPIGDDSLTVPVSMPELAHKVRDLLDGAGT